MSDDSLQWLNDEINSECNQSMLQRAQHIVRHERDAMLDCNVWIPPMAMVPGSP